MGASARELRAKARKGAASNGAARTAKTSAASKKGRTESLYKQLGGRRTLRAVVDAFYERVTADPQLVGFFEMADMAALKEKQVDYFALMLGGPKRYKGRSMREAHQGLSISAEDFGRVAGHLVETLESLSVPKDKIDQVVALVAPLQKVIVERPHAPGNGAGKGAGGVTQSAPSPDEQQRVLDTLPGMHATLEALRANVLVAGSDLNIEYANPASLATLVQLEEELEEAFGISADEVVGGPIHRFHRNPKRIERILTNPDALPHTAELCFGEVTLKAEFNCILGEDGSIAGYVVNWEDATEKLELAARSARVESMMDNAPVNVLFCDLDMTITYANPASLDTLAGLEQYLPCKVADLIGQSVDIFHKDPAHQRRILADPANLPHRAVIDVGPERLSLLVTATLDAEGNYIGPMVTWDVVTEKLAKDRELARIESMIENAPINILYCDAESFTIQYANPASDRTLRGLEQYLPCRVSELIGQSIDIFHKDPAHQRRLLSNPDNLPHRAQIDVGPEKLDLLVTAARDNEGAYVGAMVTWEVVTDKLKKDREMARIFNMMENAPVNVVYADRDFTIQYVNPASMKQLRLLQEHLPIRADDIVGHSIDVFHKDPAHQRRLLSNPDNLPHSAHIQLGPETLSLLVSPIYDNNNEFLGPMVTWEVITQKLRQEQEIESSAQRERQAADELKSKVDAMLGVVRAAAGGDLTQEVTVGGDDAIGQMGQGLAEFLQDLRGNIGAMASAAERLGESSGGLTQVAQNLSATSEEASEQATSVAAASEQVSRNVDTVATGAEEMSASIKEIANNANEAARVATTAVGVADTTNSTISKLGESSSQIGKVIKVITSIAQQTNLLALNATIEAARAGEAGKGFAVVANEVKELARETAKATEDISGKIEAIQTDTRDAVSAIGEITEIINRINEIQNSIASAVEEQTATTAEIGRNVAEAARGSQSISETIQGVAAAAGTTAEGAGQTNQSAEELSAMARELNDMVRRFNY